MKIRNRTFWGILTLVAMAWLTFASCSDDKPYESANDAVAPPVADGGDAVAGGESSDGNSSEGEGGSSEGEGGSSEGEGGSSEGEGGASENGGDSSENGGRKKILVAYYSHSGNTRTIAGYIHDAIGGDTVSISTVNSYPDNYDAHLAVAREEVAAGYRPPITTRVENVADYDVVFVGYPIWVETAAPPVVSFVANHNLAGKTVVPFCTSGTSSAAESYRLIASLCGQSEVREGLQIRRGTYDTARERVLAWLRNLGYAE